MQRYSGARVQRPYVMGLGVLLLVMLVLGACTEKDKRVYFGGNYYPARAKKIGDDRQNFQVTVRRSGQGSEGAREAGRHAGFKYCIENYGYSKVDWINGPDAKTGQLTSSNGNLIFKGRCRVWE